MTSIMFVIGIELKSYKDPQEAIHMLKTESMTTLFDNGIIHIQHKIAVSRRLQKHIISHLLNTPHVFYRSTIVEGIHAFFKMYCPQFSAHEIHITADYPVYIGRPKLNGIEFIEQYLRCIEAENAFCICFSPQNIHHLLCGITQDYHHVPMNIFEPVLLSALGLIILKRHPQQLHLTKKDIDCLYQRFSNQSQNEIALTLKKAFLLLNQEIKLPKISKTYISLCIPQLARTIQNSITLKTLDKVFIVPAYPKQEQKIIFSYGKRMDDHKYQKLIDQILNATHPKEKISLINNEVHSLSDLLDILSDALLNEEELELFVNMLSFSSFLVLLSQYPCDDFLTNESEQLVFRALQKRKQQLSFQEQKQVEKALKTLQVKDFY